MLNRNLSHRLLPLGASSALLALCFCSSVALGDDTKQNDQPERARRMQGNRGPGGFGGPGAGGPGAMAELLKRHPLMRAIDADGDGTLSQNEISGAVAALQRLDRNGDGKVASEELLAGMRGQMQGGLGQARSGQGRPGQGRPGEGRPGMRRPGQPGQPGQAGAEMNPAQRMARLFQSRDTNGDGKLSKDEIPEQMKRGLDRIDENGDGAIDKTELASMAERFGQGGGRGRDNQDAGRGVKPKRPEAE